MNQRSMGAERDTRIVDLIRKFGLLTSDLIQQRLANHSLTSQHNILNRLKILTERKEIYNLGRIATGHIVYASRPGRRHLSHDLSVGRFGILLDSTMPVEQWNCQQDTLVRECKEGERPFIPDARFVLNGIPHFLEVHTGSQGDEVIAEKMRVYKRYHTDLKEVAKIDRTPTAMRVLFVCQRAQDVERILSIASRVQKDSMLWWICAENQLSGQSLKIFKTLKNNELCVL